MPLQAGALLLHARAQVAPQIEGVHGRAQAGHGLLALRCKGAVGEGKEINRHPRLVIERHGRGGNVPQRLNQPGRKRAEVQLAHGSGGVRAHLGADLPGAHAGHARDAGHQPLGQRAALRGQPRGQSVRREVFRGQLVLLGRKLVHAAGLHGAHAAHLAVYVADGVDDHPVLPHQRQVGVAAHHLQIERFFHGVAQLVQAVKSDGQNAVAGHLPDILHARAQKVLAHEHAEHRRLGRVLIGLGGQLGARLVGVGAQKQPVVAPAAAYEQNQRVTLGLIDLVHPPAPERGKQLAAHIRQGKAIHRHGPNPSFTQKHGWMIAQQAKKRNHARMSAKPPAYLLSAITA